MDPFKLLSDVATGTIGQIAEGIGLSASIFYIVGLLLAVGIGVFGYKLIKLLLALIAAGIGYYLVGVQLYNLFVQMTGLQLVGMLAYVPAIIFAVLFFFIGFKKFSYAFYTIMALIGFLITYVFTQAIFLAVGGAVLLALLCMFMVRVSFILLTSLAAGFISVLCLHGMLPNILLFDMAFDNMIGVLVALGVSLIFAIVQLIITRNDGEHILGRKARGKVILLRRRLVRDL